MRLRRTVERIRPGERALRGAYDEHAGELFTFAYRSLCDTALAEEAVQQTFLRAWRDDARLDAGSPRTRTWLLAACRRAVLASARSAPAPGFADGADLELLLAGVQAEEALRRLSAEHRAVLVEAHLLARPVEEVAARLRIPAATVRTRVYYALRALRLVLEEMGWEA